MKKEKVKWHIKIGVYSNGAGVRIKSKMESHSKVFVGKDYIKKYNKWIDKICRIKEKKHSSLLRKRNKALEEKE